MSYSFFKNVSLVEDLYFNIIFDNGELLSLGILNFINTLLYPITVSIITGGSGKAELLEVTGVQLIITGSEKPIEL